MLASSGKEKRQKQTRHFSFIDIVAAGHTCSKKFIFLKSRKLEKLAHRRSVKLNCEKAKFCFFSVRRTVSALVVFSESI